MSPSMPMEDRRPSGTDPLAETRSDRLLPSRDRMVALARRAWFPALLFLLPFPLLAISWDWPTYYDHYAITTKHLAERGIYSLDGVHPFTGQQPPGFSILSVPFFHVVGFPHSVKLSGAVWTGLSVVCLYLLLGETSLAGQRRPLSLLYFCNPETISVGAQWGFSESALAFALSAGMLLLLRHHRQGKAAHYLLAGLAFGYAPLIRFPSVAFALCYIGYTILHRRRLRLFAVPGILVAALPLGYWLTRPAPSTPPTPRSAIAHFLEDRSRSDDSMEGLGPGAPFPRDGGPSTTGVPSSLETYFRAISYFRAPPGERLGLFARVVARCLVTEAARIYLLLFPFVYLGAARLIAGRVEEGDRPLRLVVAGWIIYLGIHIAYGNMIPRYFLPILPFAVVLSGIGVGPALGRRWGRGALLAVLILHGVIALPFAVGPAEDAWESVLGVRVTRRAKNLQARGDLVRWANRHLPEGSVILDPKHGNEAAFREDLRVLLDFDLAALTPPAYMVDYGPDYIYVGQRLDGEALAAGEVASVTWIYFRDERGSLLSRKRDDHRAKEKVPHPDLEGEVVFRSGGDEIRLVKLH